jgi:hypothetical protein
MLFLLIIVIFNVIFGLAAKIQAYQELKKKRKKKKRD